MTVKDRVDLKPLTKPNQYYEYETIVEMTSDITCEIINDKLGHPHHEECRRNAHNNTWWDLLDEVESEVFDYLNIEMSSEHNDNRFVFTEREG